MVRSPLDAECFMSLCWKGESFAVEFLLEFSWLDCNCFDRFTGLIFNEAVMFMSVLRKLETDQDLI